MTEKDCIRDVIGYEGLYTVNVLGEIYSVKSKKKLSPCVNRFGYMNVCLYKNGKQKTEKVHRIVASAFIPNPLNKTQVNHIDGNKKNNCVWNLEWNYCSKNARHAFAVGLRNGVGVRIVETGQEFSSISECARSINGSDANIGKCITGERDTHKGFHFERIENYGN